MDNLPQHTSGVFLLRPMVGFYSGVDRGTAVPDAGLDTVSDVPFFPLYPLNLIKIAPFLTGLC